MLDINLVGDKMVGRFLRVKCDKCGNEQNIYEKASIIVRCLVCNEVLAEPTGGKVNLKVKVAQPIPEI